MVILIDDRRLVGASSSCEITAHSISSGRLSSPIPAGAAAATERVAVPAAAVAVADGVIVGGVYR
jgi:hypothetical protein